MNKHTELDILEDCMRKGKRLAGVNQVLKKRGLPAISYTKYTFYARDLAKKNLMHQRNIDAIAWHGKGK